MFIRNTSTSPFLFTSGSENDPLLLLDISQFVRDQKLSRRLRCYQ